jgi:4-hydroxy-tetrahydrodipicolinate synthase
MITGSLVALVTPCTVTVRWTGRHYTGLVEWHVAEGTHAIVAVGTTGESATLDVAEHLAVIKA